MKPQFIILLLIILAAAFVYMKLSHFRKESMKRENVRVVIDDSVIDGGDSYAVIDPVWWAANIYDGSEAYEQSLKPFSLPQRYVFAIHWYWAEVCNGGHYQFYFNSTGIVWEDALKGFEAVGLNDFSEILRKSADLLGGSVSKDRSVRQKQLGRLEPDFSGLDEKFFDMDDTLDAVLIDYIKKNRKDFYFDGMVCKPELPKLNL